MNIDDKRIAIIGRGTAGMFAVSHFHHYAKDCEIELYYDPAVNPQAVGEGSTLDFPAALFENLEFNSNTAERVLSMII